MWVYLWAVMVVPTFALFRYWSFEWAEQDLDTITNNDKLGLYSISGLLALGWPIVAVCVIISTVNRYINGDI